MNNDIFKGKWKEVSGSITETWGKLTNDDVQQINGQMTQLEGSLQKKYGWDKEKVKSEISSFLKSKKIYSEIN